MAQKKSFTLIELMVTIFILILLVTIVIIVFQRGSFQRKQNDNVRKKDINEIATAIEQFKADHGHYPYINWGPGIHAANLVYGEIAGDGDGSLEANECGDPFTPRFGTFGDSYKPSVTGSGTETPGTEIVFDANGRACDDLSLQLEGRAYLKKMPKSTTANPDDIQTIDEWIIPGRPGDNVLKSYVDEIPKDALNNQDVTSNSTDYLPSSGWHFRHLYNSYYECPPENIDVGERYWLNAIVQLKANGDLDPAINLYFYEVGNANWFRHPRSECL